MIPRGRKPEVSVGHSTQSANSAGDQLQKNIDDAGAMMNSHSIGWLVDETLCYGASMTTVLAQRGAGITPLHVSREAIEELPVPAMRLG